MAASFLLWLPWEQKSVFPSKPSAAPHHIKYCCHESASSSTGSLTIAKLTAYKAACSTFNGLWFRTWPGWLKYFKSVNLLMFVLCLNSYPTCIYNTHTHIKLPTSVSSFVLFGRVKSSAGNGGIIVTEAPQLEYINSTNGGSILPRTPQ